MSGSAANGRRLHLPLGSAGGDGDPILVTPESAGWSHAGLRLVRLEPGVPRVLATGADELAVVPLAGGPVVVECEGRRFRLEGRESVFARVTDFAYVPLDAEVRLTSEAGADVALPSARARRRLDPAYGDARAVPVEIRGAGRATRQLNNFLAPEAFPADRLCAVEVLTPAGNWSSYPPHKHDTETECEAVLEEIYHFRIDGGAQAFGAHRTYDLVEGWDVTTTVRSDDVFLVPRGYHGPSMAAPGYDMWYLNVLAGPGEERTMAFCDDPAHHWIRESWVGQELDARVPLSGPDGRR